MIEPEEVTLLRTTRDDLRWMRETWIGGISDAEIRRASAVVRRLTVDGAYSRAWRAAGLSKQPTVVALHADPYLAKFPVPTDIRSAIFGGDTGLEVSVMTEMSYRDRVKPADTGLTMTPFATLGLTTYLADTVYVRDGQKASRRAAIKYVANALGSAHVGRSGASPRDRAVFELLDHIGTATVLGNAAPYYLVLVAGHTIAQSDDMLTFCAAVDDILSPARS